jgi:alkylhydroperoxidase family enzyme
MPDHRLTSNIDRVWRLPDHLRVLRPEAVGLLDAANQHAWRAFQPTLLEQVRLRVGALIGNEAGLQRRSKTALELGLSEVKIAKLGDYYSSAAFSQLEKDCLALAEQFVIDVSGPIDGCVSRLREHFADQEVRGFVVALYIMECTQRLEMVSPALLGTSVPDFGRSAVAGGQANTQGSSDEALQGLHQALSHYQNAVMRGTALDPLITEMVRLRCARTHDCRICKTLRLAEARAAGADDAMTAKVDFYERSDLDERTKIALRITDAFITRPDSLAVGVISQARSVFSPEELAELCLDITKWSTQKIHVTLGTDAADALPKNDQGLSFFNFDEGGRVAGFSATPESPERAVQA